MVHLTANGCQLACSKSCSVVKCYRCRDDNTKIFYNFVAFYELNAFRMKKVLNEVGYVLVYGTWYLLSLLPMRLLYVLSDLLYLIMAYILRYRHRVIWKNLSSSFPEKSHEELVKIEKDFYHWFCDYLVETIKLMTMSKKQLMRRMQFTGIGKLNEVLAQGQSCAIYLGHYCNWEWISSLPLWLTGQTQCCQLYHPLENKCFDYLFRYVRERQNALCIPMQESLRKILSYEQQHQTVVVGYIADQVPLWHNIHHWVDFLHHDTPVLTGAERIVKKTNQVCFYGDMRRVNRGYYQCEMRMMTENPRHCGEWEITNLYFKLLEETIQRQPALWLWSHNRWKRTRAEYNSRFPEQASKNKNASSSQEVVKLKV